MSHASDFGAYRRHLVSSIIAVSAVTLAGIKDDPTDYVYESGVAQHSVAESS
ncbi:hypothetical protein QP027_07960 [Corynebacterium breve]|uniref:Uncharacterized protein n=1 Tax=Corynebacterium breve TaxID=3049799 RepID=A0ABY8VEK4_9CORY|nr:hypothetical protein [Corynebacterium breve]WIM67058.1 hypothetical protein QP027_07960 [Corynebacterium breve]